MSSDRTPERWERIRQLHDRALERPRVEREAFLREECGSDTTLLDEVLALLGADPGVGFLEPPGDLTAAGEGLLGRELGDYTLLEEIGRGGMGVVFKARQKELQRPVALKVLLPSLALTQRQVDRFRREARAAARLKHPHIVSILSVGEERGTHFFAMEWIEGRNLAEELVRLRAEHGGRGAPEDEHVHLPSSHAAEFFRSVAELMRQTADALEFAHSHGIVHRDVKPANLILDEKGEVQVVDFGLARDEAQGSLTQSNAVLGTPHYMSPEQARGSMHRADHRTDVYSLGVVLYELLTLCRPFEGRTSREVLSAILNREAQAPRRVNPRIPHDLETICLAAMEKDVHRRYSSAKDLRDDLGRFLGHEAIRAKPPGPLQRARRLAFRHRVALSGLLLLLTASGLGWTVRGHFVPGPEAFVTIEAPGFEGALVHGRRLDPLGPEREAPRALGRLPLERVALPLGLYRFTVEAPEHAPAELTRALTRVGQEYTFGAPLRSKEEIRRSIEDEMVRIPAGDFVFGWAPDGDPDLCPPHQREQSVFLEEFWIDRTEVSNARYLEFIRTTGRPWPTLWPEEGSSAWNELPANWREHPASGTSFHDARDFAEWAGKRLPTQWEWEKAARGLTGFHLPWQQESEAQADASALERAMVGRLYSPYFECFENYLQNTLPVDSLREGASPFGLFHVLGNVREWTESPWYSAHEDGSIQPAWDSHVVKGGGYDLPRGAWTLSTASYGPNADQRGVQTLGFRCARSVVP